MNRRAATVELGERLAQQHNVDAAVVSRVAQPLPIFEDLT